MEIKSSRTLRGFALGEFVDLYGDECSIQKSSLATDDAIWLGITDAKPKIMARDARKLGIPYDSAKTEPGSSETTGWERFDVPEDVLIHSRMHLNREQVKALLPTLKHFVKTGELP